MLPFKRFYLKQNISIKIPPKIEILLFFLNKLSNFANIYEIIIKATENEINLIEQLNDKINNDITFYEFKNNKYYKFKLNPAELELKLLIKNESNATKVGDSFSQYTSDEEMNMFKNLKNKQNKNEMKNNILFNIIYFFLN